MKKNNVLVIIVTFNAMKWINRCLNSLLQSDESVDVFIIDNGSTDGTQDYIKSNYHSCIFIQNSINSGFGQANNVGLKYAINKGYKYAYLLNQDAWIFNDTISVLVSIMEAHHEYAIISPLQVEANLNRLDNNFIKYSCSYESNPNIISDFLLNKSRDLYDVQFVMAAHWLVSIDVIKHIGIFSPSFPHYREDNNLIDRALFHGYKVGIATKAKAVHDREKREVSIEKEMYLLYTIVILKMSDPTTNYKLIFNSFSFIKGAIKYRSVIPLKHLFLLWKNIKTIKANRLSTINQEGSFIN
ncbi:MAG: glycosyltransferase [Floccifex sp.]